MVHFYFILISTIIPALLKADCDKPSATVASGTHFSAPKKLCPGDLIFEDQFDRLDLTKWKHEVTLSGSGNNEFEYYLNNRTNSFVKDGILHIRPTYLADDYPNPNDLYSKTLNLGSACTDSSNYGCSRTGNSEHILNPIKSAKIRTTESFSFKYGTAVFKAKVPAGDWLWPALWFLPTDFSYGAWPISGEIDLMESRGNRFLQNPNTGVHIGTQQVSSTMHWGTSVSTNQFQRTHYEKNNIYGYDTDFHIYKVVWDPSSIRFYVDDVLIGNVTPPEGGFYQLGQFKAGTPNPWSKGSRMAPFDQRFYIIINLAVGGTHFFPDGFQQNKPWKNDSPTAMRDFWQGKSQWSPTWGNNKDFQIDYVKVYAI